MKKMQKFKNDRIAKLEGDLDDMEMEVGKQRGENDKLKRDKDAHVQDKNQELELMRAAEQQRIRKLEKVKDEKISKLEADMK